MRSFKPMKVYYLIDEIRRTDAKSKGVNSAADSDELLKELVYKILH
jgi:DNA polymerase-3 subunit delta